MKRKPDRDVLRCSFCAKAQDDVRKLIAGPNVFICNECVEVCVDIIANDSNIGIETQGTVEGQRLGLKAAAIFPKGVAACSFCGQLALPQEMLAIGNRGMLCGQCATAIEDTFAQGKPIS